MFGGGGGATRCQRTRREGRCELVCRSWKESQAGKNPWEDGRSREHRGRTASSPTGGREREMGAQIHTDHSSAAWWWRMLSYTNTPSMPLGRPCRGPLGRAGPDATCTGGGGGMSMKVCVMLGAVTSLRLHSRVFWWSQLKMRLLLIVSPDHSFFNFSFIYLYPALFWGKKKTIKNGSQGS